MLIQLQIPINNKNVGKLINLLMRQQLALQKLVLMQQLPLQNHLIPIYYVRISCRGAFGMENQLEVARIPQLFALLTQDHLLNAVYLHNQVKNALKQHSLAYLIPHQSNHKNTVIKILFQIL